VVFISYLAIYAVLAFVAVFVAHIPEWVCHTFLIVGMLAMLGLKYTKVNDWFEKPFMGDKDE